MQLSSPALWTPPSEASIRAAFVALLPDATMVTGEGFALRIGETRVGVAAGIVTATVVGGQVWVVTREHALRRYAADGTELAPPMPLAALAGEITIVGTQRGPRAAVIESEHWCAVIRERDDASCAIEELGARTADRKILVGTRTGARQGASIRLGQLELAIPADLASARIGGSAVVLDGSTLLVELVGTASSTLMLYSLRHGRLNARIRIGESRLAAVAERANLTVLARDEHVALLDLRVGRCTAERILTRRVAACAIDELGATIAIVDAGGTSIRLNRALTDLDGDAGTAAVVDAPLANDEVPATDEVGATDEVPATDDDARELPSEAADAPEVRYAAGDDAAAEVASAAENDAAAEVASPTAGGLDRDTYLHALGAPRAEPLSREQLAEYLAAAHAWVEAVCAVAIAATRSDASALATARERERAATECYARWGRRGAPHVEVAHELDLSPTAATVLLLIAAPQIWCELARDYAAVARDASRPLVDEVLIATLLQAGIVEQSALARELDGNAPLVRSGAV
ncbi:MAG TPA: hypothetical protein VL326_22245, partial [Kofleriaceae bacterium]|nr:hypothetical protein [Kofleriaceae bacterium]